MSTSEASKSNRRMILWGTLSVVGLMIRLLFISSYGMLDMDSYITWGQNVNELGLAEAYTGIYFPLQWQFFQVAVTTSDLLGISPHAAIKIMSLLFEIATFVLLMLMLKQHNKHPAYALIFWCHPWFITITLLGYIDIHYCFFILLTAYLADRSTTFKHYTYAGIPLALTFLMKPQVEVLILASGIYIFLQVVLHKKYRLLGLTIAPALLFIGYSFYFLSQGHSFFALADSYIHISDIMPSICAQMLNIWYPLAYLLTEPGRVVFSESDLQPLIGPFFIRHAAIGVTLTYLAFYSYKLSQKKPEDNDTPPYIWLHLLAYASLVLPMLMTSAHENHGYLASILLVLLLTHKASKFHLFAFHLFLFLQFINLLGLYGVGANTITEKYLQGLMAYWTPQTMLLSSILTFLSFLVLLHYFFHPLYSSSSSPKRAWIPSAAIVLIFTGIYTLTLISN